MQRIDATTRVCALVGHPVGHSLSPAIHNAAFEALGLDYVYVAHDVAPDRLRAAIEGVRALGYRGLSITIPHKVTALRYVDEVEPTAARIGCINTIINQDGLLVGHNSDGRGALQALRRAGVDPAGRSVLILGSGGAARAVAMTLAAEATPAHLGLLGIELDELEQLRADLAALERCPVRSAELDAAVLAAELGQADMLLHCTPVGMHPDRDRSLVVPELLRPELAVFDAVYNPRQTRLLQDAARAGCPTIEGSEMFLGQAMVQFELWTGRDGPIEVMRRVLEERL